MCFEDGLLEIGVGSVSAGLWGAGGRSERGFQWGMLGGCDVGGRWKVGGMKRKTCELECCGGEGVEVGGGRSGGGMSRCGRLRGGEGGCRLGIWGLWGGGSVI